MIQKGLMEICKLPTVSSTIRLVSSFRVDDAIVIFTLCCGRRERIQFAANVFKLSLGGARVAILQLRP